MLDGNREIPGNMPGVLADEVRGQGGGPRLILDDVVAWAAFTHQGVASLRTVTRETGVPG